MNNDTWSMTPGESGLAWYWENEINGYRVTIIERPAIGYCCWMAATMTEASDVQTAATLNDAKRAATDWARSH